LSATIERRSNENRIVFSITSFGLRMDIEGELPGSTGSLDSGDD
jgi:hypothetical protein